MSVQLIPHRTAHSIAGTISLGLGIHGPAVGVNGGAEGDKTGLLSLASIMQQPAWRGVWLVASHWSPEAAVDEKGSIISDSVCLAAALALAKADVANPLGYLRIEAADGHRRDSADLPAPRDSLSAESLLDYLFDDAEHRDSEYRIWQRSPANDLHVEIGLTTAAGVAI